MFEIEYCGGNCLSISTKDVKIIVDPKRSVFGLKDIVKPDAVELGTEDRLLTKSRDYRVSINGPGEYEVSNVLIRGIPAHRSIDNPETTTMQDTIYRIEIEDCNICVIGNISKGLSEDQQELIGMADVLVIPVGGNGYTLDATDASAIASQVGPKIIIPVHYDDPALNYEVPQSGLVEFIEKLKLPVVKDKKLKLKSSANLPESMEIYELDLVK